MTSEKFNRAALPALTRAIAEALGDGWTLQSTEQEQRMNDRETTLSHTDGRAVRLSLTDNDSRLILSGLFGFKLHQFVPREHPGNGSIGVAITKSAAQIAADLSRRHLPAYTEALALTRKAREAAVARKASDLAIAAELAKVAGTKVNNGRYGQEAREDDFETNPTVWLNGTIATVNHGRVSFERVTVGAAVAKEIIAALKKEPK